MRPEDVRLLTDPVVPRRCGTQCRCEVCRKEKRTFASLIGTFCRPQFPTSARKKKGE
jgi:hypothetical protein